jgi:outer membrane immunogenic protein
MKGFLIAAPLLVLFATQTAWASDRANDQSNIWSGSYVGAYFGWGHSRTKGIDVDGEQFGEDNIPGTSHSFQTDGLVVGGTVGYNIQRGSFVFGPEFDFGISTNRDTLVIAELDEDVDGDGVYTNYDFFGSLSLRAGYAFRQTLVYAKGGLALAKIRSAAGEFDGLGDEGSNGKWGFDGDESGFGDKTRAGWMVGAGIEHMLQNRWSVKLEYSYADFGGKTYTDLEGDGVRYKVEDQFHNIKVGLSYHF